MGFRFLTNKTSTEKKIQQTNNELLKRILHVKNILNKHILKIELNDNTNNNSLIKYVPLSCWFEHTHSTTYPECLAGEVILLITGMEEMFGFLSFFGSRWLNRQPRFFLRGNEQARNNIAQA